MFGSQALRLLREGWSGARQLAEEVYAILSSDRMPLEHSGPITLNNPNGSDAPIWLRGFSNGDTVIKITKDNEDHSIRFGDDGTIIFPGQADSAKSAKAADPAKVVSYGIVQSGSGNDYIVTVAAGNAEVAKQIQIASGEKIPAGTGVILVKVGGVWRMQAPVFM